MNLGPLASEATTLPTVPQPLTSNRLWLNLNPGPLMSKVAFTSRRTQPVVYEMKKTFILPKQESLVRITPRNVSVWMRLPRGDHSDICATVQTSNKYVFVFLLWNWFIFGLLLLLWLEWERLINVKVTGSNPKPTIIFSLMMIMLLMLMMIHFFH